MVKIKDIAEATGYSVTTVSKAFNDYPDISSKAKERILKTAKAMGYIPNAAARGLVTKRSYMIGVIFDEELGLGIRHPFFGAVIEFFKEEMEQEGYDLVFISKNIGGSVKTYIDHCRLRGVDGIFIACANLETDLMKQLIESRIPSVTVEVSHSGVNSVNSDDYQGAYDAVTYLYNLGHRRIAHISGTESTHAGRERLNGYLKAVEDLGCDVASDSEAYRISGGMFSFEGGIEAMKQLMTADEPPTAVFAAGDLMALGALRYLNEVGVRVPDDISVMGFDKLDFLDFVTPKLTTVEQNVEQLGRRAAKLLIQNMNDPEMKRKEVYISTKVFEGNSCRSI